MTADDIRRDADDVLARSSFGEEVDELCAHTPDETVEAVLRRRGLRAAVPATEVERIRACYVPPQNYAELERVLRQRRLLVLRAPAGWGRTATAVHLLARLAGAEAVHRLAADRALKGLDPDTLPGETGYLLDVGALACAAELRTRDCDRLAGRLAARGSWLAVTVDQDTVFYDDLPCLVEGGQPPDPMRVFSAHLAVLLRGAGRPDAAQAELAAVGGLPDLLARLWRDGPNLGATALLAREIISAMAGRLSAEEHPEPASAERRGGTESKAAGGHVFVSCARADEAYAGMVAAHLRAHGVQVWTDAAIAFGADWPEAVQKQIDSCAAFVVVMSPAARRSAWVRREVLHAQAQGKQIFPLLLSGTPLFAVGDLQYEDVRGAGMPSPRWVDHLRTAANHPAARPV